MDIARSVLNLLKLPLAQSEFTCRGPCTCFAVDMRLMAPACRFFLAEGKDQLLCEARASWLCCFGMRGTRHGDGPEGLGAPGGVVF